jgi:hypothetical protein
MRHSNRKSLAAISILLWIALSFAATAYSKPALGQQDILLDPPTLDPHALSFRATGTDPDPPRYLVLWRLSKGNPVRLNSTRSGVGGRFDFGQVPIPISEGTFHVSPRDEAPDFSRPLRVTRVVPGPRVLVAGPTRFAISVFPALYEGELRIRDAKTARLWLRRVISGDGRRSLRFDLNEMGLPTHLERLTIEQTLEDGRRSELTYWDLEQN